MPTIRRTQHPGRMEMVPVPGMANTYDMRRAEGEVYDEGTPYTPETTVPPALARALGIDPKESTIATALEALRQLASAPSEVMQVKRFEAKGTYPARYELGCTPPYVIARGHANGGKTAVSIIFPGPASNGGTVTMVDQSGVIQNFYTSIEGTEIVISQSPGGAIAGAHNVRGEFENFIFPAASAGSGGGGGGGTYILPQATANTLGGVKVQNRTPDQTEPAGIDPKTGLIYTRPITGSGGGSGMKEYTCSAPAADAQKRMTPVGSAGTPAEGELFAATFANGNSASGAELVFGGISLSVRGQIPGLRGYECIFYRDGNSAQLLNPQGGRQDDGTAPPANWKEKVGKFAAFFNGTGDMDSFLFFSDPHYFVGTYEEMEKSLDEMEAIYSRAPMNFCLCGGDWLTADDTPEEACFKLGSIDGLCRSRFPEYVPILGNHDTNYQGASALAQKTLDNLFFRQEGRAYYRYKSPTTAYYILDSGEDWHGNVMNAYNWGQIDWLATQLKVHDDKHAVVAMHMCVAYTEDRTVYKLCEQAIKVVKAYNAKTAVSLNGKTYTFSGTKGTVHCILGGHNHEDWNGMVDGVPVILETCVLESQATYAAQYGFDLCILDYKQSVMRTVRFGKGADRTVKILPSGGGQDTIKSNVVRAGLAFYLDGADRGGTPGQWVDKISGVTFDLTGCVEAGKGVTFDGTESVGVASNVAAWVSGKVGTVEIAFSPDGVQDYVAFMGPGTAPGGDNLCVTKYLNAYYYRYSTGSNFAGWTSKLADTGFRTVSMSTARGMENKVTMTASDPSGYSNGAETTKATIGRREAGDYGFKGTIYAIRMYDRILTEEEINQNQTDDTARYQ